ncbi:MAG: PIN domain-containing protein [Salinibacter sp.]
MKVLLDTSVLVPALVPALPQHEKAAPHLEAAAQGDIDLFVSTHALAECYSSLTALPLSPQITPGQARRLLRENVAARGDVVELDADDYLGVLQRVSDLGLRSGAVYDALHVRCAENVPVQELRTPNGQDFRRMPPADPTELVVL